jgi:hypothetical protein
MAASKNRAFVISVRRQLRFGFLIQLAGGLHNLFERVVGREARRSQLIVLMGYDLLRIM